MSQSEHRLALSVAADLARKIRDTLAPMCEPGYCVIAGSIRRQRPTVGDIEIVCVPKFSKCLIPDVPGESLLDVHLNALAQQGRLLRASKTPIKELVIKPFYVPSLYRDGKFNKVEIYASTLDRWPVELAIRTGGQVFSKKLVTTSWQGGFLPRTWEIRDGWQVWEMLDDGQQVRRLFANEEEFITHCCGRWIPPEERD